MRNFNPFLGMPQQVLQAPADGAGTGGANADSGAESADASNGTDDDSDDGERDAGDAGDAEGHDGRSQDDDEDDEDLLYGKDEDEDDDGRTIEERHKALSRAHNKLKRRLGKRLPTIQALKAAGIKDASELSDLFSKSRSFDALLERAGGDPNRLLKLVLREQGEDDDSSRRTPGEKMTKAEAKEIADEFNLSDEAFDKLWDTSTESGKFFKKLAQSHGATHKQLKDALARLDRLEGGIRQKDESTLRSNWVSVIDAGAKKISSEGLRRAYSNLMKAGFQADKSLNPAKLSQQVMNDLGINPTTQKIVQGAQQQRMAQTNQRRPQHQPGGANTTAAPARGKRETVADVSRRIRRM